MSDWKIIDVKGQELAAAVMTLGASVIMNKVFGAEVSSVFTIQNEETGEIRHVVAADEDELGEKIANGDFDDED
jgi:hypothetical protein